MGVVSSSRKRKSAATVASKRAAAAAAAGEAGRTHATKHVAKGKGAAGAVAKVSRPAKNQEAGSYAAPKRERERERERVGKDEGTGGKVVAAAVLQAERSPPALPIPIASFTF
jgi:hypothetical protein